MPGGGRQREPGGQQLVGKLVGFCTAGGDQALPPREAGPAAKCLERTAPWVSFRCVWHTPRMWIRWLASSRRRGSGVWSNPRAPGPSPARSSRPRPLPPSASPQRPRKARTHHRTLFLVQTPSTGGRRDPLDGAYLRRACSLPCPERAPLPRQGMYPGPRGVVGVGPAPPAAPATVAAPACTAPRGQRAPRTESDGRMYPGPRGVVGVGPAPPAAPATVAAPACTAPRDV
jgi:hypothetical protein